MSIAPDVLGTVTIPVTFNVPATLTPVEVMFASSPPLTFNSMLPSATGIRTFDVPF